MDWTPYAEQFAWEPATSTNSALYPQYGFADLGENFRLPLHAAWRLQPVDMPALGGLHLFFTADEPLLYAADAGVRIFIAGRQVGLIKARSIDAPTGPFVADISRELLLVPPVKAFGYQFPIADIHNGCRISCVVSVAGTFATWRVYRVGFAFEAAHFNGQQIR